MKAKEFIVELANFSYEIMLRDVRTNGEIKYFFETETGEEFEVYVENPFDPTDRAVSFRSRTSDGWADTATGTAGSGAVKIFSTVVQCIKDALATFPEVDTLYFSSTTKEISRLGLYQRFANNVSRYLPGWRKASSKIHSVGGRPALQVFTISRLDADES